MMDSGMNLLEQIQAWYASMCNDDWEHTYGIFISNIDNPGWSLKVELKDTYLYDAAFEEIKIQRSNEDDWVFCKIEEGDFQGYGGPENLSDLIEVFLEWAENNAP